MDQRLSVVTLGVSDVQAAAAFYERLGWRRSSQGQDSVAFFDAGGLVLALFGRAALAEDADVADDGQGFDGVALAQNQASREAVDAVLREAGAAGAQIVKPPADTFWGGYAGYFADPDGHLWEIAWNPFWPLDGEGRVQLPA